MFERAIDVKNIPVCYRCVVLIQLHMYNFKHFRYVYIRPSMMLIVNELKR